MLRTLAIVTALAFTASSAFAAPALDAQGKCRDGGKFVAASMCAAPAGAMSKADHPKNCKKGKACGNTCISVKDTCHIK